MDSSTALETGKKLAGDAAAIVIAGLIFVAPPFWAAWRILTGGHLLHTETVEVTKTVTRQTGTLPDVVPVLLIWLLAWVILGYMVVGPRPMR